MLDVINSLFRDHTIINKNYDCVIYNFISLGSEASWDNAVMNYQAQKGRSVLKSLDVVVAGREMDMTTDILHDLRPQ